MTYKKDKKELSELSKLLLEPIRDQIIIPRIGKQGVYVEPVDYINTPKGIVLKRGSGHSA